MLFCMHRPLKLLGLFAGIGGFELGLQRSGLCSPVAFCEANKFRRAVLKERWPDVPCYPDIRELTGAALRDDGIIVEAICGGFPCQGISAVGNRAGLADSRSGLWSEYRRLIGELRPRLVFLENSPNLRNLGLAQVLGDLAALRYDAIWDCIPASRVGAHHQRDRIWLIAYPSGEQAWPSGQPWKHDGLEEIAADARGPGLPLPQQEILRLPGWREERRTAAQLCGRAAESSLGGTFHGFPSWLDETDLSSSLESIRCYALSQKKRPGEILQILQSEAAAQSVQRETGGQEDIFAKDILLSFLRELQARTSDSERLLLPSEEAPQKEMRSLRFCGTVAHSPRGPKRGKQRSGKYSDPLQNLSQLLARDAEEAWASYCWQDAKPFPAPGACLTDVVISPIAYGVPNRVSRISALGDAIVPQIPELIGRAFLRAITLEEEPRQYARH